ncbi:MAG: hypothetical protein NVS3B12_08040 [Acidimicrobiales bacterium]
MIDHRKAPGGIQGQGVGLRRQLLEHRRGSLDEQLEGLIEEPPLKIAGTQVTGQAGRELRPAAQFRDLPSYLPGLGDGRLEFADIAVGAGHARGYRVPRDRS